MYFEYISHFNLFMRVISQLRKRTIEKQEHAPYTLGVKNVPCGTQLSASNAVRYAQDN